MTTPGYSFEFYTTIGTDEREVLVKAVVSDYWPAKISGPPETCYPAEGGDVELQSVRDCETDNEIELTPEQEARLLDEAIERSADRGPCWDMGD